MPDFSQFFSAQPWGSWGSGAGQAPPQPPMPQGPQVPPEVIAALRAKLGLDEPTEAQTAMTHQPEQPNPAAPFVNAVANRLQPLDLAPVHLPGTEPKDYLRELSRNPDILARAVEQAQNFNFSGTSGGKAGDPGRIGFSSAGAQRGPITNKQQQSPVIQTPEAAAKRKADMKAAWDKLMGNAPAEKPVQASSGGERIGFKSLGTDKTGTLSDFITAYHGSPHDFDRFDLSKIGTGEGAQAYGHGLYFAENEGVAKGYRNQLTRPAGMVTTSGSRTPGIFLEGKPFEPRNEDIKNIVQRGDGDPARFVPELEKYVKDAGENPYAHAGDAQTIINAAKQGKYDSGIPGRMYQVAIKAPPEHFLDWDKPLSEQSPKVQEAIGKFGIKPEVTADELHKELINKGWADNKQTRDYAEQQAYQLKGAHFYRELENAARSGAKSDYMANQDAGREAVTQKLREAGIPGIKYLDQGSRPEEMRIVDRDNITARSGDKGPLFVHNLGKEVGGPFPDHPTAQKWLEANRPKKTSNYVVFDDKLIDILKKYGIAGLAALPAMNAYHYQDKGN